MTYELRPVVSASDWEAMHAIRRATLLVAGRHTRPITYDDQHPDDRKPGNQCFLFVLDGRPIGVTRLDRRGDDGGVIRLVAIVSDVQRAGHGRAMGAMVEDVARARGMKHLVVNAAGTATGFYERTGWLPFNWDPGELAGIASHCVQMTKPL